MSDFSGKSFGPYQIIEPITSGGMATIYKAYQVSLDRIVAIKILPEYLLAQAGFLERFKIEAQAIAKLDHPHILPVYDYGQYERLPYLVMKYVPDGTLKDLILKGRIAPREAAPLLRQVAEALDYAHRQDIIHRDVKPSNILLQGGQWALLMDFGLAKLRSSSSNITASGTGVGTPDYMAPEQAQGRPVDARADIYSLGVVLYQMLTGDVPFRAESPLAVMLKQIADPPPLPSLKNPSITPASEQVILRALAKAPDDRYASAVELAAAFENSLDSKATLATVPGPQPQPVSPSDKTASGLKWAIGAIVVVALATIALVALFTALGSSNARSNSAAPVAGPTAAPVEMGALLLDDFGGSSINTSLWQYTGSYTLTLDSPSAMLQNGRMTFSIENPTNDYHDGALYHESDKPLKLISARVTLLDATGFSDFGLQVNGLDGKPDTWAYLGMTPSDGTVSAYVGDIISGTQETYVLLQGNGMPATHELAMGWDGTQITFFVDGQARKSLPTTEMGKRIWLLFDVDPQGKVSGSFDDVRITYAEQ
jgi:serine/threonine protein kinase